MWPQNQRIQAPAGRDQNRRRCRMTTTMSMTSTLVVALMFIILFSEPSHGFPSPLAIASRRSLNSHREIAFMQSSRSSSFRNRRLQHSRLGGASQNDDNTPTISDKTLGILVLLTVPLSWGTYTPVVKYLYEIQPPVPGFVFSTCYYALAAVTTTSLALMQREPDDNSSLKQKPVNNSGKESDWPIQGGLELGSYLFVANCLQVVGLQTVASDRAGFLVQLTTVMVPFVEALLAGNLLAVPVKSWFACVLAFLGLFVMGLDGKAALLDNPVATLVTALSSFTQGDLLIVGAAVLYTLHVVRLGRYARETTPIRLAASKATTEAVFSIALVGLLTNLASGTFGATTDGLLGFAASTGREISSFFSTFVSGVSSGTVPQPALYSALGATLWTGWVTCAYTIYAQSFGQSRVSPTNANLIYTFQPIFTALFAFVLLGETMGPAGFFGGGLIGLAVYMVASSSSYDDDDAKTLSDNDVVIDSTSPLGSEENTSRAFSSLSSLKRNETLVETRVRK